MRYKMPEPPPGRNEGEGKRSGKSRSSSNLAEGVQQAADILRNRRRDDKPETSRRTTMTSRVPLPQSSRTQKRDVFWWDELRSRRRWVLFKLVSPAVLLMLLLGTYRPLFEAINHRSLPEFGPVFWILCAALFAWLIIASRLARSPAQSMRCFCPHCDKHIPAKIEWQCGVCEKKNGRPKWFSFFDKCGNCGSPAKAYRCHHCGKSVFLDDDRDDRHAATKWEPPAEPETEATITARFKHDKLQLEFARQLEEAAMRVAQIKSARRAAETKTEAPVRSLAEVEEERMTRTMDVHLARIEFFARKKAEAASESDPDLRERKLEVIDWLKHQEDGV